MRVLSYVKFKSKIFDIDKVDMQLLNSAADKCKSRDTQQHEECNKCKKEVASIISEYNKLEKCTLELSTKLNEISFKESYSNVTLSLVEQEKIKEMKDMHKKCTYKMKSNVKN